MKKIASDVLWALSAVEGLNLFGGFVRDTIMGVEPKDMDIVYMHNGNGDLKRREIIVKLVDSGFSIKSIPNSKNYQEMNRSDEVTWKVSRYELGLNDETIQLDLVENKRNSLFNQFADDFEINRILIPNEDFVKLAEGNAKYPLSMEVIQQLTTKVLEVGSKDIRESRIKRMLELGFTVNNNFTVKNESKKFCCAFGKVASFRFSEQDYDNEYWIEIDGKIYSHIVGAIEGASGACEGAEEIAKMIDGEPDSNWFTLCNNSEITLSAKADSPCPKIRTSNNITFQYEM